MNNGLPTQILSLPETTGVYLFKNKADKIVYVGKAINIRKRVASYFARYPSDPKVKNMLESISKVEVREANSEIAALLLESELIKKFRPFYNIRLKDDSFYSYIKITKGEYPGIEKSRQEDSTGTYFGPYPLSNVTQILRDLRRHFPFRDCTDTKFTAFQKLGRPCLYGNIDLCPAPCIGRVTKDAYRAQIRIIRCFLSGKRKQITTHLAKEMNKAAKDFDYEKAGFLRDQLKRLSGLFPISPYKDPLPALGELAKYLDDESINLARIEAYDISNISGKFPVGSLVVLTNGSIDKKMYRRFKLRGGDLPDDYRMMEEVLRRRLTNTTLGSWPGLIIVDGGKGQLAVVLRLLDEMGLNIPVAALAKKMETLYLPANEKGSYRKVSIPRASPALLLLQRIRDESHRFALSYHRLLRKKGFVSGFDTNSAPC
ncbi:MAG: excinuclease ABC subunit UvrC [Patescibacteria group bacterium]